MGIQTLQLKSVKRCMYKSKKKIGYIKGVLYNSKWLEFFFFWMGGGEDKAVFFLLK